MSWHERLALVLGPQVKGFGPLVRCIPKGDETAVDILAKDKAISQNPKNAPDSALLNAVEKDT
jgi:hypothetical protein